MNADLMSMKTVLLCATAAISVAAISQGQSEGGAPPTVALINGKWFNGRSFETRTMYSAGGRFTLKKPARLERTVDLGGTWIVPPFGEAHNHNLGTGIEEMERNAVRKYLADGVFYVKIQGNFPVSEEWKKARLLNRPDGLDAVFAQGSLTASGGHPIQLVESLLARGYNAGGSKEALNNTRYFTIDSAADLGLKWPLIVGQHPDFIKAFLWFSDEFAERKDNTAYFGQKGLDPGLLPKIVERAHAAGLRVSVHVTNSADFHNALAAGVDEITHLPLMGEPIRLADAKLVASRGITVITTCGMVRSLPRAVLPEASIPGVLKTQAANLKLLRENGVVLAVGSDNVTDSSVAEFEYLKEMQVFDNLSLLRMWTGTTAQAILPNRRIGELREGFEASFLALEGNPIEDLGNVRKIRMRFKQGWMLEN
jgi:hypothetical protein